MKQLYYHQTLELQRAICSINLESLSEVENWELQGRIMAQVGFSKIEAKFPHDTYVGTHRLNGWKQVSSKEVI